MVVGSSLYVLHIANMFDMLYGTIFTIIFIEIAESTAFLLKIYTQSKETSNVGIDVGKLSYFLICL